MNALGTLVIILLALAVGALALRLRRARREVQIAAAERTRLQALIHQTFQMVGLIDEAGVVHYLNPAVNEVMGYRPQEVVGSNLVEIVHPGDVASFRRLLRQSVTSPRQTVGGDFRARGSDGSWRHLEGALTNLVGDLGPAGIVANFKDISERYVLQERITRQAFADNLTHLPNRALFQDRLSHGLRRASRRATSVGVLLLDIDTFKVVNESLGPALGDRLLVAVSERLRETLRPEDTLARLGGDEFAILLEDIVRPGDATRVAERINEELRAPFVVASRELFVTVSTGIVVDDGNSKPEVLLRNADLAMYAAKEGGRARHALFDPSMTTKVSERFDIESDLRRGVPNEMTVHYQPVVDLVSGRIVACEALVRWLHPRRGLVTPAQFIRVAEETDLIFPLSRYTIGEACRQLAEWRTSVPGASDLVVGVNISAKHLRGDGLADLLREVLDGAALPPDALELEVTESVALTGVTGDEPAFARLRALRDLGVRIAIDDFGTGYSALTYLKHFPVDTLKVDRSFVNGLGRDPQDKAIVGAILAFGQALGLVVTAEGIETVEQLRELSSLRCDRGQGYYFARALPAADFEALLRDGSEIARAVAAAGGVR